MYSFFYDLLIRFALMCTHAAAWVYPPARTWLRERTGWRNRLIDLNPEKKPVFWMHVSSLGEFEQGRTVLDAFRAQRPNWFIVLSFFSPSGYQIRKNYAAADFVCYLPPDTRANARLFVSAINPAQAVFVKYDFWYHHLHELKRRNTPLLLISAVFRAKQPFFKWYGGFWRQMLDCFSQLMVQDRGSATLLLAIGYKNVQVIGDTRLDRVLGLAENARKKPIFKQLFPQNGKKTWVAGSIWKSDAEIMEKYFDSGEYHLVLAPHDMNPAFLAYLKEKLHGKFRLLSVMLTNPNHSDHTDDSAILVDTIGHLNQLYQFADLAYIGGGFGAGIHNTLEPAAYGIPVVFGPKYEKFVEARDLVACGGAFSVQNAADLESVLLQLDVKTAQTAIEVYLNGGRGATLSVMQALALHNT
jgi:3-deoxy-D-manno-octulosonic-acid transferase